MADRGGSDVGIVDRLAEVHVPGGGLARTPAEARRMGAAWHEKS
jgi:hypothetical protein